MQLVWTNKKTPSAILRLSKMAALSIQQFVSHGGFKDVQYLFKTLICLKDKVQTSLLGIQRDTKYQNENSTILCIEHNMAALLILRFGSHWVLLGVKCVKNTFFLTQNYLEVILGLIKLK